MVERKLIHLKIINDKTWMIYEVYHNKQMKFYMGQPVSNKNCYRFGKTENELYENISKYQKSPIEIKKEKEEDKTR